MDWNHTKLIQILFKIQPKCVLNELLKIWRAYWEHWIIRKKVDVSMWHMLDIVATCIVLCNICTIGNGGFNKGWIEKVEFFYKSEQKKKHWAKGNSWKVRRPPLLKLGFKFTLSKKCNIPNINLKTILKFFSLMKMRKMKIYYMKAQGCMKPYLSHYSITNF